MSYESEHNELRQRFETQWASETPVAWPNVEFKPPEEDAWVRFTIVNADARQASFGDATNFHRHPGMVMVQVFTPVNRGDKEALQLADQVANIFRNWYSSGSRIRFQITPTVKPVGVDRNWFQVNVSCPYIRDSLF